MAELALQKKLTELGVWFKPQAYFHDKKKLFFPDFRLATTKNKLVVEVDGKSHLQKRQIEYDLQRSLWLRNSRNCIILRFTNEQVLDEMQMVIDSILNHNPLMKDGTYYGYLNVAEKQILDEYKMVVNA